MAAGADGRDRLRVFVSYSRRDRATADAIVARLESSDFDVIIDRRDLPYGEEWQQELSDFIQACDTVIWLVSPDSIESHWCNWELGEVARTKKRLMPIRIREVDPATLPKALGRIHLLPAEAVFDLDRDLPLLVDALNTDRNWIKDATRLGDRARQWRMKGHPPALLLWGTPLKDAETWKDRQPRGGPAVSEDVFDLILASRRAATRRGRWWVAASLAIGMIGFGLAGLAYWQREIAIANESKAIANEQRALDNEKTANEQRVLAQTNQRTAEENAERAQANERTANAQRVENLKSESRLAAVSAQQLVEENRAALAQTIALEGLPQRNPPERPLVDQTLKALHRAIRADRSIVELTARGENVLSVAFTPDAKTLVTGTSAGNLIVWDLLTFQRRHSISTGNEFITQIDINADGTLALVSGGNSPGIWNISTGTPALKLPVYEKGYARSARFSPDGRTIALGLRDNRAEIRDTASGRLLHELKGPDDFDAAYQRRAFNMWSKSSTTDPIVMAVEQSMWRMFGGMTEVLFTPDGEKLVTAGAADAEGAARIFETTTGRLLGTLHGESLVNSYSNQRIAVSPDGKLIAISSRDRVVRIWDSNTNKLLHSLPHTSEANAAAFDPSGEFLAAGYNDGSVRIWSTADGGILSVFTAHLSDVMSIDFSPDRRLLATSSGDRTVRLWWNTLIPEKCKPEERRFCDTSMRPAAALRGHTDTTHLAVFSPDGASIASVSRDETVRLWRTQDAGTKSLPFKNAVEPDRFDGAAQLTSFIEPATNFAFSPDGKQVIAANFFNGFTVWDANSAQIACRLRAARLSRREPDGALMLHQSPFHTRPADCTAKDAVNRDRDVSDYRWVLSPDGTRAVGAKEWLEGGDQQRFPSDQEPRRLFDLARRMAVATLTVGDRVTYRTDFSPDSAVVLGALVAPNDVGGARSADEFAVWDSATGQLLGTTGRWKQTFDVQQLSESGKQFVLAATRTSTVVHFTVRDDRRLQWQIMAGPRRSVSTAGISARGDTVAAAYDDGSVILFSGTDGKVITNLFGGGHPLRHITFSPDSRLLVGWDDNQTVWIWDIATSLAVASTTFKNKPVGIRFSPNLDRLAIQTDDAGMHVMTTDLTWLGLERPEDLVDWARGSLSATSDPGDRQRFLIQTAGQQNSARSIPRFEPTPVPPAIARQKRPENLADCDRLAANPTDRDRQANGIAIERIDRAKALAACERAVATTPDDHHAVYQLGRVHESAGRASDAIKYYRLAADAGYAVAIRRIGQLIDLKSADSSGLGASTTWFDRAAAAGDPIALRLVARRVAATNGNAGVADALRLAAAAHAGGLSNAALQVAIDLDEVARTDDDRERVFFYFQIGLRLQAGEQVDANLKDAAETRLRILPRQLSPAALVRQYRAARDWRPM